jgi:hypothetical protein
MKIKTKNGGPTDWYKLIGVQLPSPPLTQKNLGGG